MFFFFFKQKTAYEIGTGDWSSDVCSSDLGNVAIDELVDGHVTVVGEVVGQRPRRAREILAEDRKSVV